MSVAPIRPPAEDTNPAIDAALAYIRLGWAVLPLNPGTKKPLGKLVPRGFQNATKDEGTARQWWSAYPNAGIGIALQASGLVAVDIDPRNGGIDTIDQLEAMHGPIVSDVHAYTGGGGEHRVFSAAIVSGLPGTLGPGVDLKSDGYIAAEPTIHPSGKAYAWEASSDPRDGVVPSTLPGWIRDLGRAPLTSISVGHVSDVQPINPTRLRDAKAALPHIPSDDRDTWFLVGMAIHQEMPNQAGFDLWAEWSKTSPKFDPQDQLRVWNSFRRRNLAEKRVDMTVIFRRAQEQGWKNGAAAVAKEPEPQYLPILSLSELRAASAAISWSVKHIIPADSVGILFGASGTFKSFVALDYALHVAHGLPWLGRKTKKGPVLFIAAEGGAGLWRRVDAWHRARGMKWEGIEFYVVPVAVMLAKQAAAVVEAAAAVGVTPAVVIVDTMSQTFDGEENSANEVASYLRELGLQFRALWHCVILVIHHNGHSATERPRGSSAIRANVDFMLGVFRDETSMIATVTCVKQKDGELFDDAQFQMTSYQLGRDEDGEAITSLAARHLRNGEELVEAMKTDAAAGRGGRNQLLLSLVQNGMQEKGLRKAFYEDVELDDPEARRKAFNRAKKWAVDNGFIEVAEGVVILLGANK